MDGFTTDVDARGVLAALDRLGAAADRYVKAAAKETADAVAREMTARLARQLGPDATGETVRGIVVVEDASGTGYLVVATNARMPNLPFWLEQGTKHMAARPFFYASALLEEGPHRRRIVAALQAAIEESGLGA